MRGVRLSGIYRHTVVCAVLLQQAAQVTHQRHTAFIGTLAERTIRFQIIQPGTDLIHGIEEQVDVFRRHVKLAAANRIQHILCGMNHPGECRNVEKAGRPLDGVHGPKQIIEEFLIARSLFQLQETPTSGFQVLPRLRDKGLEHRIHI